MTLTRRPASIRRPTPRTRRTGWRAALHAVALGVSTGLLLAVVGIALVVIVIPKATGSTPLTVLTQSMEPTLPPGTLLVVRPTPVDDVHVGDVVTYQITSGQPEVVSHRVVSIATASDGTRTFVLKGDNNAVADAAVVVPAQVCGVVWYSVPGIGWVNQLVNGSRSWLVPTVAAVLLTYGAVMIIAGTVSAARRRRRRARRSGARHVAGYRRTGQPHGTVSSAG
ncbi:MULTISPECIES: signal peptidase I [unclassified Curtobacterium]|uniref:signal peptidase I n=1 Tax=unclassified Curtobacterium TaxID=257496 RepID=UPI00226BB7CA|nr:MULTISPECIES: signal peptidase I [unclassified Curtobacterium]